MRKFYLRFVALLLITNIHNAFSQCTPDQSYTAAGLYPDSLPDGTVGQLYSQDVTIVFFKDTTQSGITCTATEFEIYGLAGLPPGLTWQANSPNNKFYPQQNLYGCVNISGTPIVPGTYKLIASGNMVLGGDALCPVDNPVTYEVPFVINAASASNAAFTMSTASGCAPLTVDFSSSNSLSGNYNYFWEFGDSNSTTSTVKDPSFNYANPGTYVVTQTATNIDPVKYLLSGITIDELPGNKVWQPGLEIENPTWPLPGDNFPDVYIKMYDSNNKFLYGYDPNDSTSIIYLYDQVDNINGLPVSYPIDSNYQYLNAETYRLEVYDADGGLGAKDDYLGYVEFFGNGPSSTDTYSFGTKGTLKVTFTINNTAINPITVTDTIEVFPVPSVSVTSGLLSFCEGDSVTLLSNQTSGNQWYGDTALIFGADSSAFTVKVSGNYYVIATNQYGCTDTSAKQTVVVNLNPPKPTYWSFNDTLWTSLTGYDLQWYMNGIAISGATNSYCPITATGLYSLGATSSAGCYSVGASTNYTYIPPTNGIDDIQNLVQDIHVFPNPSNGQFNISFIIEKKQDINIVVEDVIGNIVLNIPLKQVYGQVNQNMDISYLAKGLYYAGINVNYQQIRKKIIVQ